MLRRKQSSTFVVIVILLLLAFVAYRGAPHPRSEHQQSPSRQTPGRQTPGRQTPDRQNSTTSPGDTSRHDLLQDEARGGHTLRKHVGKSDADLFERLHDEPQIAAASTYKDRATAEQVIATALAQNQDRIARWLARTHGHPNLTLDFHANEPIGRSIQRGSSTPVNCYDAVVILKWDGDNQYFVLTSYPEASR